MTPPSPAAGIRRLRRIYAHLPLGILALIVARTTPSTTLLGLIPVALGLLLRIWASGFLEKGGELCTDGPYRYLRHPLYLGSLLAAVGFCIMVNVIWGWLIILPLFALIYALQVVDEERHLREAYGAAHEQYARRVPALLPLLGRVGAAQGRRWSGHRVFVNREHWHLLVTLGFTALFAARTWLW
ncbi:MAG: isoprenylcysteine carboxylmethyltransferase family protein [Armatimonadota bacterium]